MYFIAVNAEFPADEDVPLEFIIYLAAVLVNERPRQRIPFDISGNLMTVLIVDILHDEKLGRINFPAEKPEGKAVAAIAGEPEDTTKISQEPFLQGEIRVDYLAEPSFPAYPFKFRRSFLILLIVLLPVVTDALRGVIHRKLRVTAIIPRLPIRQETWKLSSLIAEQEDNGIRDVTDDGNEEIQDKREKPRKHRKHSFSLYSLTEKK